MPVIPGSPGVLEDEDKAVRCAKEIGFPVILKASAGGGGRGMRVVRSAPELAPAFRAAQAEAQGAFGVPDVYLERYVEKPRHIEIQVMADTKGNVVHLGERECSIQRRHQKIIEEAPSPFVTEKLRRRMGQTAVEAAQAVQYVNAGTIEFLVDAAGNYYFMEMNTRIQVEHGVTELVTGRDLVKEQILVAAGEPLSFAQKDIVWTGPRPRVPHQRRGPGHLRAVARAPSATCTCPAGPGSASTPTPTTAARSRPTTTAWSPS